jgi:hypothetical protein
VGLAILVLGSRQLEESRDPAAKQLPDFLGVALLILGVGALNLAIVASQAWTWSDVRTVSSLVFGFLAFLWFLRRARRVPVPAIDLTLFSDPNYRYANLGAFFFGIAFNAMFLGNVLFLTQVWHYSTLLAGLAITPGPLAVIPTAVMPGGWRRSLVTAP